MAKMKMKSPAAAQSALTFEQLYERSTVPRRDLKNMCDCQSHI